MSSKLRKVPMSDETWKKYRVMREVFGLSREEAMSRAIETYARVVGLELPDVVTQVVPPP